MDTEQHATEWIVSHIRNQKKQIKMTVQHIRTFGIQQKNSVNMEVNLYINKSERYQINDLWMHFKDMEKQQQTKPIVSGKE